MEETKKPGRPRKHADEKARVQAWRRKQEKRRLDMYVDSSASWQLDRLAKEWNCSVAGVVERLIMEAGEKGGKYEDVLFPVTE